MNPSAPDLPPETAARVADVIEYTAKTAISLSAVWAFIALVAKPFLDWRRKRLREAIREALKPELELLVNLPAREAAMERKLDLSLRRQEQVFDEIDLFVVVVADGRDRLEEMQDLLNASGFASNERRKSGAAEKRRLADEALEELQGRLRARRRAQSELREMEA